MMEVQKNEKPSKTLCFQGFFDGTGDRIRTNDTPGMNRIFTYYSVPKIAYLQGFLPILMYNNRKTKLQKSCTTVYVYKLKIKLY